MPKPIKVRLTLVPPFGLGLALLAFKKPLGLFEIADILLTLAGVGLTLRDQRNTKSLEDLDGGDGQITVGQNACGRPRTKALNGGHSRLVLFPQR